jgi:hypothetical protein
MEALVPQMTDDQELLQHMLEQRAAYRALAKQTNKIVNKVKARTTYNERYANDPDFRQREKERMLGAYYLKKEERKAAGAAATTAN